MSARVGSRVIVESNGDAPWSWHNGGVLVVSTGEQETVWKTVAAWPREDQIAFARMILQSATARDILPPQRPTWRQMAGLASNTQHPPSDDEIARWLDEHRIEKYG